MSAWLTWHPVGPRKGDVLWPFAWGQADSVEPALCSEDAALYLSPH